MTTTLKRSKGRKVTNSVTGSGNARGANSFGLPSSTNYSCPGATSFCEKICYAGKIEKMYTAVKGILVNNWNALQGKSVEDMTVLLSDMISDFVKETDRINAKGNVASYDFRIHWDGDFFSRDYAMAWSIVIQRYSTVRFWAYTRTLDVVEILAGIPNLSLYISTDPINRDEANAVSERYGVTVASLADTFVEAREAMPKGKAYDCPENGKRMPLITPTGSACITCGICPSKRGNVAFAVSGK